MSKQLPLLATVIGAAFVFLALVYALVPAKALPAFVLGYDPALNTMHVKHGLASPLAGVTLWGYAWFATRERSSVLSGRLHCRSPRSCPTQAGEPLQRIVDGCEHSVDRDLAVALVVRSALPRQGL